MKITLRNLLTIINIDNGGWIDNLYINGTRECGDICINEHENSKYLDMIVDNYEVEKSYANMEYSVIITSIYLIK